MQDQWKWLKQIGRHWCILTHEDGDADPSAFLEILIVPLTDDRHVNQAVAEVRERFSHAVIRMLKLEPGWWRTFRQLRRWRGEQLSAVVLLSLDPRLVAATSLWFPCYKLLYNRWGEWYLIRRKTLREWLVGRRGADDLSYDWPSDTKERQAMEQLAGVLTAVPRLVYQSMRAIRLSCWVLWRIGRMLIGRLTGSIHESRVTHHESCGAFQ